MPRPVNGIIPEARRKRGSNRIAWQGHGVIDTRAITQAIPCLPAALLEGWDFVQLLRGGKHLYVYRMHRENCVVPRVAGYGEL
ncbi:MAG: hypothetical protein WAO35_28935 [Terriglobia bacterium]